jgi:hypothetical protein
MKHASIFACALLIALAAGNAASAQMLPPGASRFSPPPPAPPPSPKIEVPVVPQMDAPIQQNYQWAPGLRPSLSCAWPQMTTDRQKPKTYA